MRKGLCIKNAEIWFLHVIFYVKIDENDFYYINSLHLSFTIKMH